MQNFVPKTYLLSHCPIVDSITDIVNLTTYGALSLLGTGPAGQINPYLD